MPEETYNPWTIVNLVFHHLAEQGLHPMLGDSGHPGEPAAELLRSLGITPVVGANPKEIGEVQQRLADLRATFLHDEG